MAIIDVVKLDFGPGEFVKKFGVTPAKPEGETELSTWTQLIVNESQEAVLYRQGAFDGPFGPGRHVLSTENLPIVSKLLHLPFGRSPFTAEVWFINRAMALDVKWGTREPIKLTDPKYDILIPVSAYGQFGLQVTDCRKFLIKLVGTLPTFDQDNIQNYFRGMVLTVSKTVLANEIITKKISVLDIATQLIELSAAIESELKDRLAEFGLKLVNFFVNTIDVDDSDPSIGTLKDALAKRAEMKIIGTNYQQERSLDILESAAKNEGSSGTVMGAGMGLGLGVAMGGSVGNAFGGVTNQLNPNQTQVQDPNTSVISMEQKITQLKQLAELKVAGILTESEFEQQKAKILNG